MGWVKIKQTYKLINLNPTRARIKNKIPTHPPNQGIRLG